MFEDVDRTVSQPSGEVSAATSGADPAAAGEWPVETLLESWDASGRELLAAEVVEDDSLDPQILVRDAAAWAAVEQVERAQWAERVSDAEPHELLALAAATRRSANLADARLLELAAGWADRHGVLAYASDVVGSESLVAFGGDGTPAVAEFCPAELGAAVGLSPLAARSLIADALDLRHRLRLLWAGVQAGLVTPWVARKVAVKTRALDAGAAAAVDAHLGRVAATLPPGRLLRATDAAVLAVDTDRAEADAAAAAGRRGFWLSRDADNGLVDVWGSLDAPDATAVDAAVDKIARALTVLGDTDPVDVRRAKALGLLADPTAALNVLARADHAHPGSQPSGDPVDGPGAAGDGDGVGCDPGRGVDLAPVTLYAHTSLDALRDGYGVARVEDIGPVVLSVLRRWLPHRHVTLNPVIDLNRCRSTTVMRPRRSWPRRSGWPSPPTTSRARHW